MLYNQDMNSFDMLIYLKELLILSLDELNDSDPDDQFCCGERIAFVECLESLQLWESAKQMGLNFNVEERYTLT